MEPPASVAWRGSIPAGIYGRLSHPCIPEGKVHQRIQVDVQPEHAPSSGSKFSLFCHTFFPKSRYVGHWCPLLRSVHKERQGLFTLSDRDRDCDIARNGQYSLLWDYLHLAMTNIKGKVMPLSQSQTQSLSVNRSLALLLMLTLEWVLYHSLQSVSIATYVNALCEQAHTLLKTPQEKQC